jgi:type II secretory pathway predicted ATPase ExeA
MYESFFQLNERPFSAAPRLDRYFPARAIEAARQTLTRCIERAEGAALLVGPSGSGKSLLCQLLADQFQSSFAVALLANGRLSSRRALLQAILFELGLPYRGMEEGELRLSLIDYLAPSVACPNGMVLLIDEAHTLPTRLLEEVRLITNLVRNGQPRVRLLMAGGPSLEERFASPKLASFSQRLTARCYLESWDKAETAAYIRSQILAVGGQPDRIFTADALESVYRATDGIPRLVNQVCDHALMLAFAGGQRQIHASGLEEAWADLQQLPTPWSESRHDTDKNAGVVEFGGLDEDEDFEPAARPAALGQVPLSAIPLSEAPTEQLDRISAQLSAIDDEYHPLGPIGPEAELSFMTRINPFTERFDEEEVVIDRYASFDAGTPVYRPQVASAEGRLLSSLLEPHRRMDEAVKPTWTVAAQQPPSLAPVVNAAAKESIAKPSIIAKESHWQPAEISTRLHTPPAERETVPLRTVETAKPTEPADAEIMIVEDDPPEVRTLSLRAPAAKRLEYRQLFARLQRG